MNHWPMLILSTLLSVTHVALAQQANVARGAYPYTGAYLSTGNELADTQKLVVFPAEGEAFTIPLPLAVSSFAFSLDGKTLYGAVSDVKIPRGPHRNLPAQRLCKIEFNPARASLVPGSEQLTVVYSGRFARSGQDFRCGWFGGKVGLWDHLA
jgi:hypothetical protein